MHHLSNKKHTFLGAVEAEPTGWQLPFSITLPLFSETVQGFSLSPEHTDLAMGAGQ